MKTSRLVVLAVAVGAGGACAGLARGSDGYASPAGAAEPPQTARDPLVQIDAGVIQPMAAAHSGSVGTEPDSSILAAANMIAPRSGDQALRPHLGTTVDRRRPQSPTAPQ